MAHTPNQRVGFSTRQCYPDGRMRLLIGLWYHGHVLEGKELSGVGELLLFPRFRDNLKRFEETTAALRVWHIVPLVVAGESTAPHPKIEAATTDMIHGCGFLGKA